jgi:hypothetical protein
VGELNGQTVRVLLFAGATLVVGLGVAFGQAVFTYAATGYAVSVALWAALSAETAFDRLGRSVARGRLQELAAALHDLLPHVIDPDDILDIETR